MSFVTREVALAVIGVVRPALEELARRDSRPRGPGTAGRHEHLAQHRGGESAEGRRPRASFPRSPPAAPQSCAPRCSSASPGDTSPSRPRRWRSSIGSAACSTVWRASRQSIASSRSRRPRLAPNARVVHVAPPLRHAQSAAKLVGAAGRDPVAVLPVAPGAPTTLGDVQGHARGRPSHLVRQRRGRASPPSRIAGLTALIISKLTSYAWNPMVSLLCPFARTPAGYRKAPSPSSPLRRRPGSQVLPGRRRRGTGCAHPSSPDRPGPAHAGRRDSARSLGAGATPGRAKTTRTPAVFRRRMRNRMRMRNADAVRTATATATVTATATATATATPADSLRYATPRRETDTATTSAARASP